MIDSRMCYRILARTTDAASVTELRAQANPVDARVGTHKQPRGRKLPSLVSEFHAVRTVRTLLTDEPTLSDKRTLLVVFHGIPEGSKLLRCAEAKSGERDSEEKYVLRVFGIYRTMDEFFNLSKSLIHPFDSFRAVPDTLLRVVCRILSRSPLETMKTRLQTLKVWRGLAESLADQNHQLFQHMDSGCATVLRGKHLALLQSLAQSVNWPDTKIHEEIREGLQTGWTSRAFWDIRSRCQTTFLVRGRANQTVEVPTTSVVGEGTVGVQE